MTFTDIWMALLPAALMIGLHLVEANIITPLIVGHRLTISPLAILISLSFWGWVWGTPGALAQRYQGGEPLPGPHARIAPLPTPLIAAAAMSGSSIIVTVNALRARGKAASAESLAAGAAAATATEAAA